MSANCCEVNVLWITLYYNGIMFNIKLFAGLKSNSTSILGFHLICLAMRWKDVLNQQEKIIFRSDYGLAFLSPYFPGCAAICFHDLYLAGGEIIGIIY